MNQLLQTPPQVLLNILLLFFLFCLTYGAFRGRIYSSRKNLLIIFVCYVFCLFSFWGTDWFGYLRYFELVKYGLSSNVPMEDFYLWLMGDVCSYYLQFRIIVWGLSLFFLFLTLRNLHLNIGLALFFFSLIYLIYFSYARVSLSITMMFYGYSCLWNAKGRTSLYKIIWAFFWILLSVYFHKSAPLGIATLFLALAVLKFGKKGPIIILVAFPMLYLIMSVFLNDYFQILQMDDGVLSEYANTGAIYFDMQNTRLGISTIINRILERAPYYLLAYVSFKELFRPSIKHPNHIRAFFMAEFLIVVFASIFLLDFGINTTTLYGRFLRFAQVPSVVVLTYLYQRSIISKSLKIAYEVGILNCLYTMSYSMYNIMTVS